MDSGDVIDLTGEPRQHKRPRRGARAPAASQPESPGSAGAAAGRPSAAAATPGRAAEAAAAAGAAAAAAPKPARGGGRQSAAGGGAAAGGGRKRQKKERQEKEKRVDEYGATVSWRPKASAAVQVGGRAQSRAAARRASLWCCNRRHLPARSQPTPARRLPPCLPQLRMERAMPGAGGHRLFLIDRTPRAPLGAPGGAAEEFAVLGATGNVYTVTIGRHPRCSCPDAGKGGLAGDRCRRGRAG